jgi:ABC-type branched-subunit amino acid transport system ATPase component
MADTDRVSIQLSGGTSGHRPIASQESSGARPMLGVAHVSIHFGGLAAVRDVALAVQAGQITSLIGPNGAGKTTLFNIIAGSLKPQSGTITFLGTEIAGRHPYEICRLGIARTYQIRNVFPSLSVYENIRAGLLKERHREDADQQHRIDEILDFTGLKKKQKYPVLSLSPLEVKLVELGRALATQPKLLLLDELLGGLIGPETLRLCEAVEELRSRGYTVLQIGHEIRPIMRTSDLIYVLSEGVKVAEGTAEEIAHNEDVLRIYLEAET